MLTDADREFIDAAASRITGSGMSLPATILLELIKPLGFVGSQALLLVEPLLGSSARSPLRALAAVLEDRQRIDALLEQISTTQLPSSQKGRIDAVDH